MELPTTEDTYSLPPVNKKIKLTAPCGDDLHAYPHTTSTGSTAPSSIPPLQSKKMPAKMFNRLKTCGFTQPTATSISIFAAKLDHPATPQNPSTWKTTEHNTLKSGGGDSQRRKRGRPRKIERIAPEVSEAVVENKPREDAGASEIGSLTEDADEASAGVPNDLADDDRPLSTCCGGIHSSTSVEASREAATGLDEAREMQVVPSESCTVSATENQVQITPFKKKSSFWKTFETLKVFQNVPQQPHFRPLFGMEEVYREQTAIGIMAFFADLVKEICSLQFEAPRSTFVSTLESLVDYEKHGFDVVMIQDRVNKLLSMKDMELDMLNESEDAKTQLSEHAAAGVLLDWVVNNIEKQILELQKELEAAKAKVEAEDHEISELQTRADAANGRICNVRHDFEKLAKAPLEMPHFSPNGSHTRSSNRKLLILDINGLLADIVPSTHGKSVVKRPSHHEFLRFCFEKFEVGVWSSRKKVNLDEVVQALFGDLKQKLLFCWDQSKCEEDGNTYGNKNKPLFLKKLDTVWNDVRFKERYGKSNTLLLDDSPEKALKNPVNNCVFPPTYTHTAKEDSSIGPEGDLRVYLEQLAEAPNVPDFVAHNRFGTDPITASSPSWSHYQKVLQS